jgi:hypothetical protein
MAIAALGGRHREVRVMAGSLTFATPRELCGLRAVVEHAAAMADSVYLDCPVDENLHRYLERMAFYHDLPANVVLSRPRPRLRSVTAPDRLIEVRRIHSSDAVEELASCVWQAAAAQFGRGRVATACATAVAAATENVLDHARSPIGGLVAAQRYRDSGLDLAVVDLGLGIPATLTSLARYAHLSDLHAVQLALADGITCTDEAGRGAGLCELVTAVQAAGSSTLVIQSGKAHVTANAVNSEVQLMTPATAVPGTWISLRLKP